MVEEFNKVIKDEDLKKSSGAVPKGDGTFVDTSNAVKTLNKEIDPYLIYTYALRDPIIRAAINIRAKKVLAASYRVEPLEDNPLAEKQLELFEEWRTRAGGSLKSNGDQVNFDAVLFKLLLSLGEGDEIYLETLPVKNQIGGELYVLDWDEMYVNQDKKTGILKGYNQKRGNQNIASFTPEQIIHKSMYAPGSRVYGRSLVMSVLDFAMGRMFANSYANQLFVNQTLKGIWLFNMSEEDFKKAKDMIKEQKENAWHDFYIRGDKERVQYLPIHFEKEMPYKDYIKENREEILIGMGVPPGSVFMSGLSGGWESDVQLSEFDEDINFIRNFVESIINDLVLPRFGFDAIVFSFNRSNKRDELREAQIATSLKQAGIISPNEAREMIGYPEVDNPEADDLVIATNPFFNNPNNPEGQSDKDKEELDQTEMEGVGSGKELGKIIKCRSGYKKKNYFRKSFNTSNHLFSKSISLIKTIKTKNLKSKGFMEDMEKRYILISFLILLWFVWQDTIFNNFV